MRLGSPTKFRRLGFCRGRHERSRGTDDFSELLCILLVGVYLAKFDESSLLVAIIA